MNRSKLLFLAAFLVTWLTATLLLFFLASYNIYVYYPSGRYFPKYIASWSDRILYSLLYAGIYSVLNTVLVFGVAKVFKRKQTNSAEQENPGTVSRTKV
jgi:uncharacterized PurR-regulated membrane protein YhhQ (DUF165 family)